MPEFFEDQHGRTVSHDETASVGTERERRIGGVFGAGERLGVGEARNSERSGHVFAASGYYGVGIAVAYRAERLSERVGGRGAGGDYIKAGAVGAEAYGYLPCRHVRDYRRNHERRDPASGGLLYHLGRLAVLGLEAADTGAYIHSEPERIDVGTVAAGVQSRVLHRLYRGGHAVLDEPVLLAYEPLVEACLLAVEVLDHSCYPDGQAFCREVGDEADSVHSLDERIPESLHVVSHGRNDAHARDRYSMFHCLCVF